MGYNCAEYKRNSDLILSSRPLCAVCGKEMLFEGDIERPQWWLHPLAATVNHRKPLIERGTCNLSNLEPAHRSCNSKLGNLQRRPADNRRLRDFGVPRQPTYDG